MFFFNILQVLQEHFGIDMNAHRSNLLTSSDVEKADYIIPVTRSLAREIEAVFPESRSKIRLLSGDIRDPWHAPVYVYKQCADNINDMFDTMLDSLVGETDV